MSCKKWTPGPWEVQTSNSWRRIGAVGGRDGGVICPCVHPRDGHPDLLASDADLQLAASAPGLYETLEEIVEVTTPGNGVANTHWIYERARAALAKARGEK